jgi:type II secretory pathway pseudopilin PulG
MIVATLLLIALTAALPSVYQEGRREQEAELVFRGSQYARAVALFHKQFNRYPVSIKELLQTNGMRFLRQEYRDPMDPKGKWRFIHVNAAGVLLDSKNQPLSSNQNNTNPAGLGQNGSTNSMFGGNSSMGGSSSFGGSSSMGFQGGMGGGSSFGGSSSMGFQGGMSGMGQSSSMGGSSQIGPTSSFFGNSNEVQGAFIAGVAATSHHESIRVWQKHQHYDEWEFIGIDMGAFGTQIGMSGGFSGQTGFGSSGSSSQTGFGQQSTSQGFGVGTGLLGATPQTPGPPPGTYGSPPPPSTLGP